MQLKRNVLLPERNCHVQAVLHGNRFICGSVPQKDGWHVGARAVFAGKLRAEGNTLPLAEQVHAGTDVRVIEQADDGVTQNPGIRTGTDAVNFIALVIAEIKVFQRGNRQMPARGKTENPDPFGIDPKACGMRLRCMLEQNPPAF